MEESVGHNSKSLDCEGSSACDQGQRPLPTYFSETSGLYSDSSDPNVSCDPVYFELDSQTASLYRVKPIISQMCPISVRLQDKHYVGSQQSQMNLHAWEYYLEFEMDPEIKDFLHTGVLNGFAIVDSLDNISGYENGNYRSVLFGEAHNCIDKLIREEYSDGKFVSADTVPLCVHSLGAVPKADGSYRPITDCSQPEGISINNFMETTHQPFNYTTVDSVADSVTQNCYMASIDISAAYRSVTISQDHWTCQGVQWDIQDGQDDQYLLDTRLSFGIRCAPYIFTCISNFISQTMCRLGFSHVANYIDDFLVFGETFEECQLAQVTLIRLLGELGFQVSWKKCCSPSQRVRYLGINFDSGHMTLSLPDDKLDKLHHELEYFKDKKRATKRQLQRLCGIVAHATKVVRGGRIFSRRLIAMLKGMREGNPRVRLNDEFHEDLKWWLSFAKYFNGKEHIIQPNFGKGPVISTDSCLRGYGIVCGEDWQGGFFNSSDLPADIVRCDSSHSHWQNYDASNTENINYLELVPIYLALCRFKDQWHDLHVLCNTDNTQVVSALNKGVSANKESMSLIRDMFWICARNNIYLTGHHIPGVNNIIPDLLSRVADKKVLTAVLKYSICCSGHSTIG